MRPPSALAAAAAGVAGAAGGLGASGTATEAKALVSAPGVRWCGVLVFVAVWGETLDQAGCLDWAVSWYGLVDLQGCVYFKQAHVVAVSIARSMQRGCAYAALQAPGWLC